MHARLFVAVLSLTLPLIAQSDLDGRRNLPSGQVLAPEIPGNSISGNSFPGTTAVTPDGRYVAILNDGWGTPQSGLAQSISVLDVATGNLQDFPDSRLRVDAHQTYFDGLVFSSDGSKLYASMDSFTDPEGKRPRHLGNGIAVYTFAEGKVTPSGFLSIPLQKVPAGKQRNPQLPVVPDGQMIAYPAGLAIVREGNQDELLVADNLADNALLLDAQTGKVLASFNLSVNSHIPAAFPFRVVAARDGRRAFCSLWNASQVVELDLKTRRIVRKIPLLPAKAALLPGSHPSAMLLSKDEKKLFVTLSNADKVAVIDVASGNVERMLSTRLPGQQFAGAFPTALALSEDGKTLFVADSNLNAIAVIDLTAKARALSASGFIPTEWYPAAIAMVGNHRLVVAAGKGRGTGPNSGPPLSKQLAAYEKHPYLMELLRGSVAVLRYDQVRSNLPALTQEVLTSNGLTNAQLRLFPDRTDPIKHVIYIIKENRTYDQVFGDLKEANGDASLCLYCADITPNQHKLARQYGIIDNFYDSGNVSGDGHVWSMAGTSSDYTERTWQVMQRADERPYDYEGDVDHDYPYREGIADVNDPSTGYIWGNVAGHKLSHRNYAEYVETQWCDAPSVLSDAKENNPLPKGAHCEQNSIPPGKPLPANLGEPHGSANPFPWPIPNLYRNNPTKPEIAANYDPKFPDFRMDYPDQLRADEFLDEFSGFVQAKKTGNGKLLPSFVILRLPNDHTAGTKPGYPTPSAAVADNDLAVGRVAEAVTHSPYYDDTAIFVVEDDAQDGADHVDAHRSIALVISKYAPVAPDHAFVDHYFYSTQSMIHTMESALGLPPMNVLDAHAPLMAPLFSGNGDQPPFTADDNNRQNGLIYKMNNADSPNAAESSKMDFTHADANNAQELNRILWEDRKGLKLAQPPE